MLSTCLKLVIVISVWSLILLVILKSYNTIGDYSNRYDLKGYAQSTRVHDEEKFQNTVGIVDEAEVKQNGALNEFNRRKVLQEFTKELPYIPYDYWQRNAYRNLQKNASCAKYPKLLQLTTYNKYWQALEDRNVKFQIYGAYYDRRSNVPNGPVVRLLTMINQFEMDYTSKYYCQLWYDKVATPDIVPVEQYKIIWFKEWGVLPNLSYPYLLTCLIPKASKWHKPKAVSLVADECQQATNNLRVVFEEAPLPPPPRSTSRSNHKKSFAICVKGLNYPDVDISARLIEWLELMHLLGVEKVFAYNLQIHPKMQTVLDYYEHEDKFLEMRPLTMAPGAESGVYNYPHMALLQKRLNEVIPYNDCFYRNMYHYEYIAAVDLDEVIMPLGNLTTWHNLIQIAKDRATEQNCSHGFSSICFRNVYFPSFSHQSMENAPSSTNYLHMLNHITRVAEHTAAGFATKCLHNTTEVVTLFNHFSLSWLQACKPIILNEHQAQLQHYRQPENDTALEHTILDRSIYRFGATMEENVRRVLKYLNLWNNA